MNNSNNTSIVEYVKIPNKITVNFQINGKEKFKAETADSKVFEIIGNGFEEFKPGKKIEIKYLFEQGYRLIGLAGNIHTYNKKPIKIYKEENGDRKKIGDGYDVYNKPYSIDYLNLLKELGYTVSPKNSKLSTDFVYKDGTKITVLKVDMTGYGIKDLSTINNITIEEIETKTVFNQFYNLSNRTVTLTKTKRPLNDYKTTMNSNLIGINASKNYITLAQLDNFNFEYNRQTYINKLTRAFLKTPMTCTI